MRFVVEHGGGENASRSVLVGTQRERLNKVVFEDRQVMVSMADDYLSVWMQGRTGVGLTNTSRRDPWGNALTWRILRDSFLYRDQNRLCVGITCNSRDHIYVHTGMQYGSNT